MGDMIKEDGEGFLSVEGVSVSQLAKEFGTPLYVYSQDKIQENVARLQRALAANFSSYRIQYALKANSNPHIVRLLKEQGLGADCSSPVEAKLAQVVGFPMDRSSYTGNFESSCDFQIPLEAQMIINLDDYHRLEDLLAQGSPHVLSFRINPGIGRGGFEGITTGGNDAKFGIPYEKVRKAYQLAQKKGICRFGIHMMTGSNILEPFYFSEVTQKLLTIIEEYLYGLDLTLEFINIGGGLGIPYTFLERELDVEQTFKLVSDVFYPKVAQLNMGDPALVIEPGRYLVGNAGILLSRVTHVKESYRHYVGLDSGMSTLLRPSLYRAFHKIQLDGRIGLGKVPYQVCGPICENSDIHPYERFLPSPRQGDLVVIRDVGAYGFAMSGHYNNYPRPAEVLMAPQGPQLIREREGFKDIFHRVPHFSF